MTEQLDRKDLKARALTERLAYLTAGYEEQVADLRVELTMLMQAKAELEQALADLQPKDKKTNGND